MKSKVMHTVHVYLCILESQVNLAFTVIQQESGHYVNTDKAAMTSHSASASVLSNIHRL